MMADRFHRRRTPATTISQNNCKNDDLLMSNLKGVRLSAQSNLLLTSTGVVSLDELLGGGQAVGTLLLIEEDAAGGSYAHLLMKYYLAEGVVCDHATSLACCSGISCEPSRFMSQLPSKVEDNDEYDVGAAVGSIPGSSMETDKMSIAWRYQSRSLCNPSSLSSRQVQHVFDLRQHADCAAYISDEQLFDGWSCPTLDVDVEAQCDSLLQFIKKSLAREAHGLKMVASCQPRLLRIALLSWASPLWTQLNTDSSSQSQLHTLCRFLYHLRSLARRHFCVVMMTLPSGALFDAATRETIYRFMDYVLRLESLTVPDGDEQKRSNPLYRDQHGLVHLLRLPTLNGIVPVFRPKTLDLGFRVLRRRFQIEPLHLPPDLSDKVSRTSSNVAVALTQVSCTSGSSVSVDF